LLPVRVRAVSVARVLCGGLSLPIAIMGTTIVMTTPAGQPTGKSVKPNVAIV
jgi:hypothetical protein